MSHWRTWKESARRKTNGTGQYGLTIEDRERRIMEHSIKELLKQYIDLKREYRDKKEYVERLERILRKMEDDGYSEVDSVTGGDGGKQHFKIEGFPYPVYTARKTQLLQRQLNLQDLKEQINNQIAVVETYINQVDDSRMRRLLTYRYIEGLSWIQVAHRMGRHHTEDSCKKAVQRFFKENNICPECPEKI